MQWSRGDKGELSWEFSLADIPTLSKLSAEKPGVVYHYTDLRGAYGILTSKTLWLSKITALNDTSEHIGLLDGLKSSLLEVANGTADNELRAFMLRVSKNLGELWESNIYVFSLSAEADSLGQWRAYGENGSGVALGFKTEHLQPLLKKTDHKCDFVNCIYDIAVQESIISEVIKLLLDSQDVLHRELGPGERDEIDKQFANLFMTFLLRVAPIIKNPYFREERESRIITSAITWDDPDYKVDLRDNRLVERFELSFGAEADFLLEEVVVGPHRDSKATEYALRVLLKKLGFCSTKVRLSAIPFRGQ